MTTREKLLAGFAGLLIVAAALATRGWIEEHDARTRAEATESAQQQVVTAARTQVADAEARAAAESAALQQRLTALEAEKKTPARAPDVAALLNAALRPAQPIEAAATPAAANLPDAPGLAIPQADLQGLRDYALTCQEDAAKAESCAKTSADLQDQLAGTKTELGAVTKERDAWKTASKGGSFWHRLGHGAKCLGVTAASSPAGAWIDKGNPAAGAGIGAVAGGTTCALF